MSDSHPKTINGRSRQPQNNPKRTRSISPSKRTTSSTSKWRKTGNGGFSNQTETKNEPSIYNKIQQKGQEKEKGGLNIELHPLLSSVVTAESLPKSQNPLHGNRKRQNFDLHAINPYLNQQDIGVQKHRARPLELNTPGKFVEIATRERNMALEQEREAQKQQEKKAKGLAPDESIAEHLYMLRQPPLVEWWDRPYLKGNSYHEDQSRLYYDNPQAPVTIYIEHPPILSAPSDNLLQESRPMHLTKDEQKRIHRNERQEKHKEKQDRIRLGLDPPPPPKVKLANLMNVLTNEAIKDPTAVEMRVRQEVEERFRNHMKDNESRKLTPEQRHEKIHEARSKDMQKGLFAAIFRVDSLQNPQHSFKVDMNAKQLELVGMCLRNPKFNLIIVEGGSKAVNFYKKLMLRRIKWTESVQPKDSNEAPPDLSGNKCTLLWEGQITELQFQKWSVMYSNTDDEALEVLNRFNAENYWREAAATED
ncbi:hypothetical protein PGUG_02919 [Meyerozyma guilliermondii ATCC 6260]|uniref:Uncharacterized protein n=1 Tax=Meyerozyma guilliermondii (strain ATCC 6260 / CBS 566 / DSM 6381 / JCM 1539 / NBRC 10279 / NRRL Y-324) TaxID=294746 RepID=A5DI18_PICGU|nr:uncharacterized protein PGUG_02919 [Meyerozyma guilliermondii ATCC 6260]EDK38821.2 hypothetical protein PGUG_02919 [Meyerozyma guilliermondii ATCC 6260]